MVPKPSESHARGIRFTRLSFVETSRRLIQLRTRQICRLCRVLLTLLYRFPCYDRAVDSHTKCEGRSLLSMN